MLDDPMTLYALIGLVVACLLWVARSVLIYFNKADKFLKYYPFAVMAAKWVENNIPDEYGSHDADPVYAKAAHKLDVFLRKFVEYVKIFEGEKANQKLIDKAKEWSVKLADRVGKKGK